VLRPFPFFIIGIMDFIFFYFLRYAIFTYLGLIHPNGLKSNVIYFFPILGIIFIIYGILLKVIKLDESKKLLYILNVISIFLVILFIISVLIFGGFSIEAYQNYQFFQLHRGIPSE